MSVCRHLGALLCTDECSLIPRWILFSFGTWNKHILELCLGVLFLKNLKNCNFGDFLKNGDFGDVIIDGSLYGQVLAYPSMDCVFLWHMEQTHIGAVLRRIIFEKSQKL